MKVIGLVFCAALLVGCGGSQDYEECSNYHKKNELNGKTFVNDDGINQTRCKNLDTAKEEDLDAHIGTAVGNQRLCQWSSHKRSDWLCVYTPRYNRGFSTTTY